MHRRRARLVILRWFNTLTGRLALAVFLALLAAQIISVLAFVEKNARERSLEVSNQFFRQVSGLVQLYNNVAAVDRQQYLRTVGGPGLHYWTSAKPSVGESETAEKPGQIPTPREWAQIRSADKRMSWFDDIRPLSMRYDISPPPASLTPPSEPGAVDGARPGILSDAGPPLPGEARPGAGGGPPPGGPRPDRVRPGGPPPGGLPPDGLRPDDLRPDDLRPDRPPPPGMDAAPGVSGSWIGDYQGEQPPEVAKALRAAYGDAAPRAADIRRATPADIPPVRWRVSIMLNNGEWLNAEHFYERGLPPWLETVLLQSAVTFAIMMIFVIPAVGLATRRVRELARASDKHGRGEDLEPLPEKGTTEIRQLIQAFNGMSHRLRRFVQGRTEMLAGISHDLRTPITALKLRTDLVDDDENRERMQKIIDEMHHLTEATLLLARDDSFTEKSDLVDLSSLIEGICDDLTDAGIDATAHVERGINLTCRPYSLRRAIRNLAENGAKYGNRARIHLDQDDGNVRIMIDDDGPGIPEDQMARAFKPFVRLEGSRSRETGGAGLGLAITRGVILNHGGEIKLSNRPVTATDGGGLRATITLPKAHKF
ncbi:MAG: HAMP domain-containing protein [Rhodospirillaceae bacterium]|nr:HAMP domain-containing protein [Rhodospirillaceae bacterium]